MTRIVRSTYRYKRPARKRKPVAPAVPAVVTIPRKRGRKVAAPPAETDAETAERPAIILRRHKNEIRPEAKSSIVTVRRRGRRFPDVPEMTPEEHRRVGDLADALWRDMVRRITDKGQP
jgi:hypothetical protein